MLRDETQGPAAARRLRERFPVVLIDEFQDTDPVQWEIVSRAFVGAVRLVLIGDPKQAIYGFRGADVTAYLQAVAEAGEVATLERNWRSEPALLEAFDALFAECTFGDPAIAYRPVQAARRSRCCVARAPESPLRLRVVSRSTGRSGHRQAGCCASRRLRPRIAEDVASDIVALLSSDTEICPARQGAEPPFRAVQPGDVAVLVRTNAQATLVRDALRDAGRAGGDRRCVERLHRADRRRLADPAGGARAAAPHRTRPGGGDDLLPRLERRAAGDGRP